MKSKSVLNPSTHPNEFHLACVVWYQRFARALPWRELWRKHQDPWHVWVSEIMLQQTVIKAVLPVYDRFLKQFPSPRDLALADTETVRLAVRGLGYYRRFDFLHKAAKHLINELAGQWPKSYDEWLAMPGIGDYTASAISSIALSRPHGVVDGNVERVMCRLFDIRTAPNLPELKLRFKALMDKLTALGSPGEFNQAIMELGQTVCTPTSPRCEDCPVETFCQSKRNGSQHVAPGPKARTEFEDVRLALLVPVHGQINYLIQRPKTAKFLKGTFGFPTAIFDAKRGWRGDGFTLSQPMLKMLERPSVVKAAKHSITKHKITAEVHTWTVTSTGELAEFAETMAIRDKSKVDESLVSNLDRKVWVNLNKSIDKKKRHPDA